MTTEAVEVPGQLELGEALRDEGIRRVTASTPEWSERALEQLHDLAQTFPHLTADDLRTRMAHLEDEPSHPNAYGAVFRRAYVRGWLEPTDATCRSQRADAHARRLVVWASRCCAW